MGVDRRTLLTWAAGAAAWPALAQAQGLEDLARAGLGQALGGGLPSGVSETDAAGALRQALTNGAAAAVARVAKLDGYWADGAIRIPLPNALAQVQKALKPIGLSQPLDDLQLKLNRGAETAAPKAKSLLVDAVKGMSFEHVAGVLRGGDRAGTDYLKGKTYEPLKTAFTPPVTQALTSAGAFQAMERVVASNNLSGVLGDDPRNSLANFAVGKALDGLFHYVALEEAAIRKDPVKRTTKLLKKVFGAL